MMIDLEVLKELLAKASAGPWQLYIPDDRSGAAVIKRHYEVEGGARVTDWPAVCNCGTLPNAANAALIVAAVNSLPALIAKAERVDAMEAALKPSRAWASVMANMRQGQSEAPRCEPPSERDVQWAYDRIVEVMAAFDAVQTYAARNALSPKPEDAAS